MKPEVFCEELSVETADWSREDIQRFWDPGRKLIRSIRRYQACVKRKGPLSYFQKSIGHMCTFFGRL